MKVLYTTNRIFTSIGYDIKPGESKLLETDISGYYPDLTKGKYRISKFYSYNKDIPITPNEVYLISKEIDIE